MIFDDCDEWMDAPTEEELYDILLLNDEFFDAEEVVQEVDIQPVACPGVAGASDRLVEFCSNCFEDMMTTASSGPRMCLKNQRLGTKFLNCGHFKHSALTYT